METGKEEGVAGSRKTPGALFCDTNLFVRILTGDPPAQARQAADALERAARDGTVIMLTDVVVAELAYVLTSVYSLTVSDAASRIGTIIELPAVRILDEQVMTETLGIWRLGELDFADAYLAALGRSTRDSAVLSFDRDYDRIPGVSRVDPAALARRRPS